MPPNECIRVCVCVYSKNTRKSIFIVIFLPFWTAVIYFPHWIFLHFPFYIFCYFLLCRCQFETCATHITIYISNDVFLLGCIGLAQAFHLTWRRLCVTFLILKVSHKKRHSRRRSIQTLHHKNLDLITQKNFWFRSHAANHPRACTSVSNKSSI